MHVPLAGQREDLAYDRSYGRCLSQVAPPGLAQAPQGRRQVQVARLLSSSLSQRDARSDTTSNSGRMLLCESPAHASARVGDGYAATRMADTDVG
eukprot:3940752-Rhodomonas_salina.2